MIEQPFLRPLPVHGTAYVEPRRVHVAVPWIEWPGERYSVPPTCLGRRRGFWREGMSAATGAGLRFR